MENKIIPTFYRIISIDYLAQNFFVMIFAGWVICAVDALFEGKATLLLLIFAAFCTPVGLITFHWRYKTNEENPKTAFIKDIYLESLI